MGRRLPLVLALLLALAFTLSPAGAQQPRTVVLKVWTMGPDNPSITRFTNIQTAAERLNAALRREGAGVQVKVEGSFDDINLVEKLLFGKTGPSSGDKGRLRSSKNRR